MKIVCAASLPFAREAFTTLGDVVVKEGRAIARGDLRDADLLVIRSTTRVNRDLLVGTRVRFVGTATIGTDHLDIPDLEAHGIHWCFAPGSNANSVAEYVVTALLTLAQRHHFRLAGKTLGVIGVGNVGSRVVEKARALGLNVLLNDPPQARDEEQVSRLRQGLPAGGGATGDQGYGGQAGFRFQPLDEVLAASDIVTLHVPLTKTGPDRTFQMADAAFFGKMKRGAIFINTARGPVVNSATLLRARMGGVVAHVVIDTWEGEPAYRHSLLPRIDIATPHIAGYSYDGRVNGTVMVYREACRFLGVEPTWSPAALLPPPPVPAVEIDCAGDEPDEGVLSDLCRCVYDIEADDARMRETAMDNNALRAAAFDRLRKTYAERREFPHTRVTLRGATDAMAAAIDGLGFAVQALP